MPAPSLIRFEVVSVRVPIGDVPVTPVPIGPLRVIAPDPEFNVSFSEPAAPSQEPASVIGPLPALEFRLSGVTAPGVWVTAPVILIAPLVVVMLPLEPVKLMAAAL